MEAIRHIATSYSGSKIAIAEFEKVIQIVDILDRKIISEFETILDFGGRRIAIDNTGQICICASYEKNRICGYETATGKMTWQRKDIKKVQRIQSLITNDSAVFIQRDKGSSQLLNIFTGDDIIMVPIIESYFESPFQSIDFYERADKLELVDRQTLKAISGIQKQSFAILDIAFSRTHVLVSESGGPLSCYRTENGELQWKRIADSDGHYLKVNYSEVLDKFIGISWPYLRGGNKKLKYLNLQNGEMENELMIDCPTETEFALNGNLLITSDKKIINVVTMTSESW